MESFFASWTYFSEKSAEFIGGIIGLAVTCGMLILIGKVLDERHDIEHKKIVEEQKARKSGESVKRTAKEKIGRFLTYYLPMFFVLLIIMGIIVIFFANK